MGMALLAFFILRSASLHLLSIWLRKLYRRVAPNSTANFCISSEIIGLHSCIESDRFSTSVLSLYTLSFRLTSSFALISRDSFYGFRFTHFRGKIEFLFHVRFHGLIVLILFSVSFLTNDWRHERICEPIANCLHPCLSTEGRFVSLHHLHRLLRWGYLSVRQI
mgnify:CR=1 FL=1